MQDRSPVFPELEGASVSGSWLHVLGALKATRQASESQGHVQGLGTYPL